MSIEDCKNSSNIMIEQAPDGEWKIKKTEEEDGFLIKLEGRRFKTKNSHLTERIVEMRPDDKKGNSYAVI